MVNASVPLERHNLRTILKAYINYHTENGGIIYRIDGLSLNKASGTNHDFAGVLARFDAELNDPNRWLLYNDKFARRINKHQQAETVLKQQGDTETVNPLFKNSILCFNVMAGDVYWENWTRDSLNSRINQ